MKRASVQFRGNVARTRGGWVIQIPTGVAHHLKLKVGDSVEVSVSSAKPNKLTSRPRKKWTLDELLAGVSPDMCGPEPWRVSMGKEIF